jgi:hypothetical protein
MGYFDKNNKFSMNVMKTICGDLKEADDQMVNLAQKTVKKDLPKHYCICMILSEQMKINP